MGFRFLKDYADNPSTLPPSISDQFREMGQLDADIQLKVKELEECCQATITNSSEAISQHRLRALHQQCLALEQTKITHVQQAYETIDVHIQELDDHLAVLQGRLATAGVDSQKLSSSRASKDLQNLKRRLERTSVRAADPIYCICKRPAFGEMVACEAEDCPTEWFHFECMGLSVNPTTRWTCPQCSKVKQ